MLAQRTSRLRFRFSAARRWFGAAQLQMSRTEPWPRSAWEQLSESAGGGQTTTTKRSRQEEVLDNWVRHYDACVGAWGYEAPTVLAELIANNHFLGGDAKTRVLDCGCHAGVVGDVLRQHGYQDLHGVDVSMEALQQAAARKLYRSLREVDLSQEALPFEDASFDVVVCSDVLSYVDNPRPMLAEWARVLRPGGLVVCAYRSDAMPALDLTPLDDMARQGHWEEVALEGPRPYYPEHPEYANKVHLHYYVGRKDVAPWAMDPCRDSGFLVDTVVKPSQVPGGGRARYVMESLPKGAVIRRTRLVAAELTGSRPPPGTTLVAHSMQALAKALAFPSIDGMPTNDEQIVNFAATPVNHDGDDKATFHWTPPNYFNHSAEPNVELALPPAGRPSGEAVLVTTRAVAAGEELYQDYRTFTLPDWFQEWCTAKGIKSTEQLGYDISGPYPAAAAAAAKPAH